MPKVFTAYYHLPGLFEFYDLYSVFLPLFYKHRDWFYEWCEIGSIYGAPGDCLWGGGRVGYGEAKPSDVLALMNEYRLSPRFTFSNSLLRPEHLPDHQCNALCSRFAGSAVVPCGVILHSDLLLHYLQEHYPSFYYVSSTTKVITDFDGLTKELRRSAFRYVVPDFRLNKAFDRWRALPAPLLDKAELLCNECCSFTCTARKACYESVSRKSLGEETAEHQCPAPLAHEGYRFSRAMENPGFIGMDEIRNTYLPMGFSQFKLEGRSLGSAVILEMLLYYMTKPEYHLKVREEIYLDSMLDLF